jgi:hypothetical protein
MDEKTADVRTIEIATTLDRPAVEALRLEILRLARRSGVDVREVRITRIEIDEHAAHGPRPG